jgi:hypothetical protein
MDACSSSSQTFYFKSVRFIQIYAFAKRPCQSTISVTLPVTENYTHHLSLSSPFMPTLEYNISKLYTRQYTDVIGLRGVTLAFPSHFLSLRQLKELQSRNFLIAPHT